MDKHILRRKLLDILKDFEPALLTIESFATEPFIRASGITRENVAEELRGLAANGYIEDKRPGREPLYRLTEKGRNQIKMECDLDEYIWGERASKFQS